MNTERHKKQIFEKIITSADIIFQVLDARNPNGTRNKKLEEFIQKQTPDKKIILIINKIDLIPKPVLLDWIHYLKETTQYEVYGLSALYSRGLLDFKKKLSKLFPKNQNRAIITGYPNVGKSSLIQALTRDKKKIGISSKAGYTRGIMEIKITDKLYLIDTPGIIPLSDDSEIDQAIKGVMNPEKVQDKEAVVQALLELYISPKKILEHFGIDENYIRNTFPDFAEDFISKYIDTEKNINMNYSDFENLIRVIGFKRGQLKSGGQVNENKVLNTIIHAWQKNKIKYFILPPVLDSNRENSG
jgi:ribosome biogenesis GTPase A